ncbi:MAG: hypothetical protein AB8B66_02440 [Rickettsiaceae bacterium]
MSKYKEPKEQKMAYVDNPIVSFIKKLNIKDVTDIIEYDENIHQPNCEIEHDTIMVDDSLIRVRTKAIAEDLYEKVIENAVVQNLPFSDCEISIAGGRGFPIARPFLTNFNNNISVIVKIANSQSNPTIESVITELNTRMDNMKIAANAGAELAEIARKEHLMMEERLQELTQIVTSSELADEVNEKMVCTLSQLKKAIENLVSTADLADVFVAVSVKAVKSATNAAVDLANLVENQILAGSESNALLQITENDHEPVYYTEMSGDYESLDPPTL